MPQPATAAQPFITTHEAATILNLSPRRVRELIDEWGIPTTNSGHALLVDAAMVREIKAKRDAPRVSKKILDVGAPQNGLAKRPGSLLASGSGAAWPLALADLALSLRAAAKVDRTMKDALEFGKWVGLKEASKISGLSRKVLVRLCDEGKLKHEDDGTPARPRIVVKIESLLGL